MDQSATVKPYQILDDNEQRMYGFCAMRAPSGIAEAVVCCPRRKKSAGKAGSRFRSGEDCGSMLDFWPCVPPRSATRSPYWWRRPSWPRHRVPGDRSSSMTYPVFTMSQVRSYRPMASGSPTPFLLSIKRATSATAISGWSVGTVPRLFSSRAVRKRRARPGGVRMGSTFRSRRRDRARPRATRYGCWTGGVGKRGSSPI